MYRLNAANSRGYWVVEERTADKYVLLCSTRSRPSDVGNLVTQIGTFVTQARHFHGLAAFEAENNDVARTTSLALAYLPEATSALMKASTWSVRLTSRAGMKRRERFR